MAVSNQPEESAAESLRQTHQGSWVVVGDPERPPPAPTPADQQRQSEDATWIRQVLAGNQAAFAPLYERYQRAIYTHAYYRLDNPHDAEDVVQEVFRRAYLGLATFDQTRCFRAWLMTITTNYCSDMQRRRQSLKRRAQHIALELVDFWLADSNANPEQIAETNEQHHEVRQAMAALPDPYREVLLLFYWNNLSYSEIADVTALKEATVKTRLHRAREKLIGLLQKRPGSRTE